MAPALAQTTTLAQASTTPSTDTRVYGVATDAAGTPLANTTVTLTGATTQTITTDASGAYSFGNVQPGIYSIAARHSGYNPASQTDVVVAAGTSQAYNVSLTQATLSSIREIGRVSTSFARSQFNLSPAAVNIVSQQTFQNQGELQVKRVLDQTPGVVASLPATSANAASPGAITFPNIRGGLSFETASLIDGHPVSVGAFGDYVTTFLNSYVLQSAELIKGPGAAAPEVNYAINGTINFRTLDPTRRPSGNVTIGVDSFGGVFSNFGYSTTINNKFGFVVDYAVDGTPGPLKNAQIPDVLPGGFLINGQALVKSPNSSTTPAGSVTSLSNTTTSLISCCLPVSTTYTSKTELVKFRYNFSDTTAVTASYLGSQTWTEQNGNHVYEYAANFAPGAGYAGAIPTGVQNLASNIFDPPHEWEINNEPIFQAELRTQVGGRDNVLLRGYTASINRLQYNAANSASQSFSDNRVLNGTALVCPVAGEVSNGTNCGVAGSNVYAIAPVTAVYNNTPVVLTEPTGAYNQSTEQDKLIGESLEYDHFLGNSSNTISGSVDHTHSTTYAYSPSSVYNYSPAPGSAPTLPTVQNGSYQDFTTLLLRGIFNLGDKVTLSEANYLNLYKTHYTQDGLNFQNNTYNHFDARLGLTFRPDANTVVRASAGSAIAPPYLADYSFAASNPTISTTAAGAYATNQVGSAALKPETSFGYDVGADIRIGDLQTVLSIDTYLNYLHNQLIRSTYLNGNVTVPGLPVVGGLGTGPLVTVPLYSNGYINLAQAQYYGVELSARRVPTVGFGFVAQAALLRAYPYNIPAGFYGSGTNPSGFTSNLGVIPGANYYSVQGVSNQAVPYSQGYGEINYTGFKNAFVSLGYTYYGPNNSFNLPAFFVANATARFPIFDRFTAIQVSADNLFNIYSNSTETQFGGGNQPLINGQYAILNANTVGPRNVRVSISRRFNR